MGATQNKKKTKKLHILNYIYMRHKASRKALAQWAMVPPWLSHPITTKCTRHVHLVATTIHDVVVATST